eukprot:1140797-Pelagomonas_calceolata.AAC.2
MAAPLSQPDKGKCIWEGFYLSGFQGSKGNVINAVQFTASWAACRSGRHNITEKVIRLRVLRKQRYEFPLPT